MANTRELQSRIKSIKDTMKITNAMYMISTTKLKKAKRNLENAEPYFFTLQDSISRILRHCPDLEHPFFRDVDNMKEEEKRVGYIVVTADKGMAGSYNHNVIKVAEELISKNINNKLYVVGQMGYHYFNKKNISVSKHFNYTAQDPSLSRARSIAEQTIERYMDGKIDEVYVIYTRMLGATTVEAETIKLLPLKKENFKGEGKLIPTGVYGKEVAMHPSPEEVMTSIGINYISGFVYGALVESYASEQNSRVMAMEAATKSAKDMLRELSIQYNRLRQAAITQEITEVVSGAKAQKRKKKS